MDLNIKNQLFVVCGATSGFGAAVLSQLIGDGAKVIAIARGKEKLTDLQKKYPSAIEAHCADITQSETIHSLVKKLVAVNCQVYL